MSRRIALIYGPETPDGQAVVTSDYVVGVNDAVIAADASSDNPLIVTLPLAATRTLKSEVTVVKIDSSANPVSVIVQGSDTISGVTSINLLNQWDSLVVEAAGTGRWLRIQSGGGGATDHGALTGLADDDHTQYALANGTRGLFQGAEPDQFVSASTNFGTAGIKPGLVLYVGAGGDTLTLPPSNSYEGQSYLIIAGTGNITVAAASGETINGVASYAISQSNLVAFTAFTGGSWITAQRAGPMFDLPDLTTATLNDVVKYGASGPEWVTGLDYEVTNATKEPIGHTNRSQSTISFNNSTRVFTIAPVSGTYEVWCSGVKYALTTQTVTLPNTTGLYYISFTAGVLGYATTYFVWDTQTPTAYVYWNATTGKAEFFADERHGVTLDWATHEYLHRTRGASLANGFGLSGYTTTGTGASDADAQAGLAGGTFFDEDLEVQVVASATPTANTWEQNLAFPMQVPVFWLSGTSWQADTATTFPLKQGAGAARAQYNLLTGSTWSAAEAGNSDYVVSWIVATNNLNNPVIAILGQASYGSLNAARNVTWEELTLTNFPIFEFRPLHKLIFQTATSYANAPSARLRDVQDLRGMSNIGSGTTTSDHGLLNGLADDDHTQYALADGTRGKFAAGNATNALATDGAYLSGAGLVLFGVASNYASTPDASAVDITGDLEMVIRVTPSSWAGSYSLISKRQASPNQSYWWTLNGGTSMSFNWSADGSTALNLTGTTTLPTGSPTLWLKVEFDVNNGASGRTATFYYAADQETEPTSWTTLQAVTSAGVTSIANTTSIVEFGTQQTGSATLPLVGTIKQAIIRNGIGGTVALNANFSTATADALAFNETSSNAAAVTITSTRYSYGVPNAQFGTTGTQSLNGNQTYYEPFEVTAPITVDMYAFEITSTTASTVRTAIYAADSNAQPTGSPVGDSGAITVSATAAAYTKQITPITLQPGMYVKAVNSTATIIFRTQRGGVTYGSAGVTSNPVRSLFRVASTMTGAYSTALAWNLSTGSNVGPVHALMLRWKAA